MSFNTNQLRDFSSLFLRSEVSRWLKNDFKSIDLKLNRYNLFDQYEGNSYLSVLRKIYKVLEKYYPNEYILKNEFLNQWLKQEIGNDNSIIFNEFRIGKAIADLAMFNGVSKVFEIKTILDKKYRLSNQLQEYKKIFNEIYIIVPSVHLEKYIMYDKTVGIITYESDSKKFRLIQKPVRNYNIDINVIMEILHTNEYITITSEYYEELPQMNAFNQFGICKELISKIPMQQLNKIFINVMKNRNINNFFFNKINSEFNQICLSLNLKQQEIDKLIYNLKSNIV